MGFRPRRPYHWHYLGRYARTHCPRVDECRRGDGTRCGARIMYCNGRRIHGHLDKAQGIAVAIPIAAAGQVLTIFVRTITVFFQHQAVPVRPNGEFPGY